jgi:hypothetical protein
MKGIMKTLVVTIMSFLMLIISACRKEEVKPEPKTGAIRLTIYQETNVPYKNARINLNPVGATLSLGMTAAPLRTGNTDANGVIVFEDLNPDNYSYLADSEPAIKGTVQVTAGMTREYSFIP